MNIYMIMKCMEYLLPKDKKIEFIKQIDGELEKLSTRLHSIKVDKILRTMGFYMNN